MSGIKSLSDSELCEAVAREVLGWCPVRLNHDGGIVDASVDEPGYKGVNVFDLNWPGIGQVVEAMREQPDEVFMLFANELRVACGASQAGGGLHGAEVTFSLMQEISARAVFEAALIATRGVET